MKKSPFSTPRGQTNRNNFHWKSNERRGNRSYNNFNHNHSFDSNTSLPNLNNSNSPGVDDFIPFSSPVGFSNGKHRGFYRGGRNRFSSSPKFHSNNINKGFYSDCKSFSPYNHDNRSSFSGNRSFQRKPSDISISNYVDFESFFEDPWKDLMGNVDNLSKSNSDLNSSQNDDDDKDGVDDGSQLDDNVNLDNLKKDSND